MKMLAKLAVILAMSMLLVHYIFPHQHNPAVTACASHLKKTHHEHCLLSFSYLDHEFIESKNEASLNPQPVSPDFLFSNTSISISIYAVPMEWCDVWKDARLPSNGFPSYSPNRGPPASVALS